MGCGSTIVKYMVYDSAILDRAFQALSDPSRRRLIFSYDMHRGDQHLSVSLTTIELVPVEGGTRLTFTEQGAFLDEGPAGSTSRVEGTNWLRDNLGRALVGAEVPAAR